MGIFMGELLVYQRVYMYISLYTTTATGVSLKTAIGGEKNNWHTELGEIRKI